MAGWSSEVTEFLGVMRSERAASPETIRAYEGYLTTFFEWAAERPGGPSKADDVALRHVRGFVAEHIEEWSRATTARRLSALRSFFALRQKRGIGRQRGTAPARRSPSWIVVQPERYRFLASPGLPVLVRIVIGEYLACEVVWGD